MTCNIYTFCQQDYGFYSAENISLISHTHLARSIFRSEYQVRSPSAENTSTFIILPVTFSVLFHQAIFPRMFQFQNLQLS